MRFEGSKDGKDGFLKDGKDGFLKSKQIFPIFEPIFCENPFSHLSKQKMG
jgi:hypothetical protein